MNVTSQIGISHSIRPNCSSAGVALGDPCAVSIRHRESPSDVSSAYYVWSQGDRHLDWYGAEEDQGEFQGNLAGGSPLMWTTSV